jgi:hypothetical protein
MTSPVEQLRDQDTGERGRGDDHARVDARAATFRPQSRVAL